MAKPERQYSESWIIPAIIFALAVGTFIGTKIATPTNPPAPREKATGAKIDLGPKGAADALGLVIGNGDAYALYFAGVEKALQLVKQDDPYAMAKVLRSLKGHRVRIKIYDEMQPFGPVVQQP